MIFVTGGTGLLGTHVLVELLRRDKKIRALYRSENRLNQVKKSFDHYFGTQSKAKFNQITWVKGDILDISSLQEHIKGCSVVYHCAALVSFRKKDFKKLMKINKEGTANVVNVALSLNVDHLCYVSSTAAIGRQENKEFYDENNKWTNSRENSNYAISKYSGEQEVWRGVEEGLNAVIVNPSVILGVGDWNESSLSIFKVVYKGLKFYTNGINAFVDARDVAYIMCELSDKAIFNTRFLTISENVSFKHLFTLIANEFGTKAPSIQVKKWMAGLAWRIEGLLAFLFGKKQNITQETARSSMAVTKYSNEKVKKALNYEFIPLADTVKHAVNYFKKEV
jgi:nucleoside-diphosphate-sugar epimerase